MLRFGLVGRSLAHSFSRDFFTEKFACLGLTDHQYDNFELADIDDFPELLRLRALRGLNVTIPYKQTVIPYLDELSDSAREVGAVNTILVRDGRATGFNTDVDGFSLTLKPFLPQLDPGVPALILGDGGAARAVKWVLAKAGLPYVVVSRTPSEEQLAYGQLRELDWQLPRLIVNTTPVGMYPHAEVCPEVPTDRLHAAHVVIDLIYNPTETLLLRAARARGAQISNGLPMLHGQAEAAWSIWTAPSQPLT